MCLQGNRESDRNMKASTKEGSDLPYWLWIVIVVIIVLALLGFLGRGRF